MSRCSLLPWACHRSWMRQNFQEPRSFVGYPLYSRESLVVLPLPDTKIDYFQYRIEASVTQVQLKSLKYVRFLTAMQKFKFGTLESW